MKKQFWVLLCLCLSFLCVFQTSSSLAASICQPPEPLFAIPEYDPRMKKMALIDLGFLHFQYWNREAVESYLSVLFDGIDQLNVRYPYFVGSDHTKKEGNKLLSMYLSSSWGKRHWRMAKAKGVRITFIPQPSHMDTLRETLFTNKRIWARDWGPIFAQNESGELYMLEPIYTRGGEDDQLQAVQPIAKHFGAKYMILPLKIEGGDLIHNGQIAFVSERVLRNLHSPVKIETESSTYTCQYRTKEDIKNVLKSFLGFKEVFLVDKFPVKPSHVDYWLKFIDEKTILLGKLYSPLYRKVEKYNYLLNAIVDDFRQRQKIDPHTIPNFWHSEPLKDYWSKLTSRHQTITKNIDDQLRRDKIWLNYYLEKSPEAIDPNEPITIPTSHREFRYRLGEPEELKKLQAVHSLNINQRQAIIWTLESQRLRRNIRPILQTKDIKVIDIPYLLYEGEYFTGNFPVNSILTSDNTVIISDISPAHKNAILTLAPNYQNDVQAAYESAGLNPRLVPLGQLEYAGNGSVHCMTLLGPKF